MIPVTSLPTPCQRPSNGMTTPMPTPLLSGAITPSNALCSNAPIPPRPMEAGLWAWEPGLLHLQKNHPVDGANNCAAQGGVPGSKE
jgi:hypothetical protein